MKFLKQQGVLSSLVAKAIHAEKTGKPVEKTASVAQEAAPAVDPKEVAQSVARASKIASREAGSTQMPNPDAYTANLTKVASEAQHLAATEAARALREVGLYANMDLSASPVDPRQVFAQKQGLSNKVRLSGAQVLVEVSHPSLRGKVAHIPVTIADGKARAPQSFLMDDATYPLTPQGFEDMGKRASATVKTASVKGAHIIKFAQNEQFPSGYKQSFGQFENARDIVAELNKLKRLNVFVANIRDDQYGNCFEVITTSPEGDRAVAEVMNRYAQVQDHSLDALPPDATENVATYDSPMEVEDDTAKLDQAGDSYQVQRTPDGRTKVRSVLHDVGGVDPQALTATAGKKQAQASENWMDVESRVPPTGWQGMVRDMRTGQTQPASWDGQRFVSETGQPIASNGTNISTLEWLADDVALHQSWDEPVGKWASITTTSMPQDGWKGYIRRGKSIRVAHYHGGHFHANGASLPLAKAASVQSFQWWDGDQSIITKAIRKRAEQNTDLVSNGKNPNPSHESGAKEVDGPAGNQKETFGKGKAALEPKSRNDAAYRPGGDGEGSQNTDLVSNGTNDNPSHEDGAVEINGPAGNQKATFGNGTRAEKPTDEGTVDQFFSREKKTEKGNIDRHFTDKAKSGGRGKTAQHTPVGAPRLGGSPEVMDPTRGVEDQSGLFDGDPETGVGDEPDTAWATCPECGCDRCEKDESGPFEMYFCPECSNTFEAEEKTEAEDVTGDGVPDVAVTEVVASPKVASGPVGTKGAPSTKKQKGYGEDIEGKIDDATDGGTMTDLEKKANIGNSARLRAIAQYKQASEGEKRHPFNGKGSAPKGGDPLRRDKAITTKKNPLGELNREGDKCPKPHDDRTKIPKKPHDGGSDDRAQKKSMGAGVKGDKVVAGLVRPIDH